jgi:hypothetical protein
MIQHLPRGIEHMGGQVVLRALGVDQQEPDALVRQSIVVNDPHTALFSAASPRPANLPDTAGAGNDIASQWVAGNPSAELAALVLRPVVGPQACEGGCFCAVNMTSLYVNAA